MKAIIRNKRFLLILFVAIILNAVSFVGISAYVIASDMAINRIGVGNNEVTITENFLPPDELKPGISIKKQVAITNVGKVPCVTRVFLSFGNQDIEDVATLNINTKDWYYHTDGYYYYKKPLDVGDTSSFLCDEIKIDANASEAALADFDVIVYAESFNAAMDSDYAAAWNIKK